MESKVEIAQAYDTVLCSPGMDDIVKIDLKISRRDVLILSHVIEKGLDETGRAGLPSLPQNVAEEFSGLMAQISKDCLEKAGLQLLTQKLKALMQTQ